MRGEGLVAGLFPFTLPGSMEVLAGALLIFGMRVADVTLGTLRILMIVRRHARWAGALAFLESLVWLSAVAAVLSDLDEPVKMIGYAGGYAAGTVLGSSVERWLAMGTVLVRIVAPVHSPQAYEHLHAAGYPATVINGEGREGEVRVVFSIVPRRHASEVIRIVNAVNPEAFVTVEEATALEPSQRKSALALRK